MATVCNMSAEIGSTSCIFPYSDAMSRYLAATDRSSIATAANENLNLLQADEGSEKHYDNIIEINLSTLEPHINGPFTPDLSHALSAFAGDVEESSWPKDISHAMIGSCTNASFEDLGKAAVLFREAREAGLKPKMPVFITAGSEKIRATVEREGILGQFEAAGATILSNSCGPCVGQWNRKEVAKVCVHLTWLEVSHCCVSANVPCAGNAQLRNLILQPQLRRQTRWQPRDSLIRHISRASSGFRFCRIAAIQPSERHDPNKKWQSLRFQPTTRRRTPFSFRRRHSTLPNTSRKRRKHRRASLADQQ
jgi:hypothetical protein